jgi:hypothetical protein
MSWDLFVFGAMTPPPRVSEMPADWCGMSLGAGDAVREKISACISGVDWSDPTWGHFRGDGFSFEFNMGRKEPLDGFKIHVRGGGDAVAALLRLAEQTNWYLLDCSEGEWLHHCSNPESGWQAFQAYRDHVHGLSSPQSGE